MNPVDHFSKPQTADLVDFVRTLADATVSPNLFNQYAWTRPENALRRANLLRYLEAMASSPPVAILVGEAAGYRGCRLTGIPFTSETQLENSLSGIASFGETTSYQVTDEWPGLSREQSATIVWSALEPMTRLPLLWNALPFHPHPPDQEWANRTPTRAE